MHNKKTKTTIVFMGTGVFASTILDALIAENTTYDIACVVTQPDKKIGRKTGTRNRSSAANPVTDCARAHNIPLLQPVRLDEETRKHIADMRPDVLLVASYGKILSKRFLDITTRGAVNVHGSLLPALRGASPVQNALLEGFATTGVTIMQMDEGMDTGDIIAQKTIDIAPDEKADALLLRLAQHGAALLVDVLPDYVRGALTPHAQNHTEATTCRRITRDDGCIDWTQTTDAIINMYRAFYPWPGVFTYWRETDDVTWRIKIASMHALDDADIREYADLPAGTVFVWRKNICVKTGDTAVVLDTIQPASKPVMPVRDFVNGHHGFTNGVLTSS